MLQDTCTVFVTNSSKFLKNLIKKTIGLLDAMERAVICFSDCTAAIILTGICLDIDLYFPDYGAFCLVYDTTQSCEQGLFIPFTIGQDTDRKHNERVPARKTFIHKDLTVGVLSNFRSDTFILLCDQVFCKPCVMLLFHQS